LEKGDVSMSWADVMKADYNLDEFLMDMKRVTLFAQQKFREYQMSRDEPDRTLEMQDLAGSIIDMGDVITRLTKMKKEQEEL